MGGRCEIPRDFYQLNKFVTLTADVMFVCGFPFLVTYSRSIKFTTTEYIPTRTAGQLAKSLMKVVYGYARGGFVVNLMLVDMEFENKQQITAPSSNREERLRTSIRRASPIKNLNSNFKITPMFASRPPLFRFVDHASQSTSTTIERI